MAEQEQQKIEMTEEQQATLGKLMEKGKDIQDMGTLYQLVSDLYSKTEESKINPGLVNGAKNAGKEYGKKAKELGKIYGGWFKRGIEKKIINEIRNYLREIDTRIRNYLQENALSYADFLNKAEKGAYAQFEQAKKNKEDGIGYLKQYGADKKITQMAK